VNTKSENNNNKYVGKLITMHWHRIYARNPSEVSAVFTKLRAVKMSHDIT